MFVEKKPKKEQKIPETSSVASLDDAKGSGGGTKESRDTSHLRALSYARVSLDVRLVFEDLRERRSDVSHHEERNHVEGWSNSYDE